MAIKKAGKGLWAIVVSARVDGVPYPVVRKERFKGTEREAKRREIELLDGLRTPPCSLTESTNNESTMAFSSAVDLYLDNLRQKGHLSQYHDPRIEKIRSIFGKLPIDSVPDHLIAYRQKLSRTQSNATVNRHTAIVKAVFNRLVALELIIKNPITTTKFPTLKEKSRDRYLGQEERTRLLSAIREYRPHIYYIIRYMMLVPCRISELTTAKREQYNPSNNTIFIPTSKNDLPIHKPVPVELVEYFVSIPKDCPYLFYREYGNGYHPITKNSIRKPWAFCLNKSGISDVRIHDLRHVSSTDLYEAGNSERAIMDIAGWKTPMLSTYRHKNSLLSAKNIKFSSGQ